MTLLTAIVLIVGIYIGWTANEKKDQVKSFVQAKLRKLNELTKRL